MKFSGIKVGQLASSFRPERPRDLSDQSASRAKYKRQVKKLESIFPNTEEPSMGRHRSKGAKTKVGKGIRKFKDKVKARIRSVPSDSESQSLLEGEDGDMSSSRTYRRKPGFRFHLITILLGILFVCSAAAFIFIPIVHVIASKYLWITFGGSTVPLVLSFVGISASTATLLSLYIIFFKLSDVRRKSLDDWTMVICYAVSALIAAITVLICALHFHDVVEIFGEEFLELLQGYWMTPKFHSGMDLIQMEFKCCGFYSYEDWRKVDVLEGLHRGYIPFSCCSMFTLRPCSHENVPRIQELRTSDDRDLEQKLTIYPDGCKLPMENYYKTMLNWAIIISSSLLVIQVFLLVLLAFSRKPSTAEY